MTMSNQPDNTDQWPDCFTYHDLAPKDDPPLYKHRKPDEEWELFSSMVSVRMSYQNWFERYSLRYFARNDLWAVCIQQTSSATGWFRIGPMRLAAWCHAPADSDTSVIATALLRTWFVACKKHGGLAAEFVEEWGYIPIDLDVVWGDL